MIYIIKDMLSKLPGDPMPKDKVARFQGNGTALLQIREMSVHNLQIELYESYEEKRLGFNRLEQSIMMNFSNNDITIIAMSHTSSFTVNCLFLVS